MWHWRPAIELPKSATVPVSAPPAGGEFDGQLDETVQERGEMFVNEGTSTYKELRRLAEVLAAPIDFDRLVATGVLRKQGKWFEVLDMSQLPEHARMKIKAVRSPNLVKFRKPNKKLRKFLRCGYWPARTDFAIYPRGLWDTIEVPSDDVSVATSESVPDGAMEIGHTPARKILPRRYLPQLYVDEFSRPEWSK
jgi:hypothetical protein